VQESFGVKQYLVNANTRSASCSSVGCRIRPRGSFGFTPGNLLALSKPNRTWGIRICIFLGEAQMEYNMIFPRIFNDIPFIGSRIFHFEAKSEDNIVFFSSLRVFPT